MDQQSHRFIDSECAAERGDEPLRRITRKLRGYREEHKVALWITWRRNSGVAIVAIDADRHKLDRNTHAGGAKRVALERIRHQQQIERVRRLRPRWRHAFPFTEAERDAMARLCLGERRVRCADQRDIRQPMDRSPRGQLEAAILRIGDLARARRERHAQAARVEPTHQQTRQFRVLRRKAGDAMPDRVATIVSAQAFAPACGERGPALREQAFAETPSPCVEPC